MGNAPVPQPLNKDVPPLAPSYDRESGIPLSRNSPESSQPDRQGRYVGPSSGISFLLRAQKRLHKIVSLSPNSSIFAFGDAPLPEFDSSFFVLPPKERAKTLVARYFDFAVPTHRFLHRPTIDGWVDELYSNLGMMREMKGDKGKKAVTFMVFAQAQEYMPSNGPEYSDCRSENKYP
jgi:galactonate dehydratase